jgi:hypothetical protein
VAACEHNKSLALLLLLLFLAVAVFPFLDSNHYKV